MKLDVSRRDFLKHSALAAAALSVRGFYPLSATVRELERTATPKKVLVVGAGLAGLSAAFELVNAGHDVTILEGQTRPGGRVQTLREPFSDGLYAEAGAGRIPDTHTWTLKYAKLFGLTLDPYHSTEGFNINFIRGKRYKVKPGENMDLSDVPLELTAEERKLGLEGLEQKYVVTALNSLGDLDAAGWPSDSLKKYDRMTWLEFLRQQGASSGAIALLELGGAFESESALDYMRDDLSHHAKRLFKIRGGNDRLPKAFASRLAKRIYYGAHVIKIESGEKSAQVTFFQAGAPQTFAADRVICTVPLTVLRHVKISPPFSPERQKAVEQVRYDPVMRVYFQARRRFWRDEGANGFAMTDASTEIWDPTFDQPGERGILMTYMLDAMGRRVTSMAAKDRESFALDYAARVHPGLREHLEGTTAKSWEEDPWARGAYPVLTPGQMTSLSPLLRRPEGRIHFASETISSWPGWMQGALEAGNRAAREVHEVA